MKVLVFLLVVLLSFSLMGATTFYKVPKTPPLSHYEHTVQVKNSSSGSDCADLNETLAEVFKKNKNNHSLELQLDEGCYNLTSSKLAIFSGWTDVAIVGKGVEVSNITCSKEVGFTFLSSFGITFRDVKITRCAQAQISTSKNFNVSDTLPYHQFWVGVYFLSCGDITMDHVEVSDTNGVGVVMYNCNSTNTFTNSTFKLNFRDGDELFRSGNVAIEFSFCQPGDINCKDSEPPSFQVTQSVYTFHQCRFQYSDADIRRYNGPIVPYPHGTEHVAFGKGAGLSVIFKGRSSGNSINIDSCKFNDNSAQWGGGLYTSFGDQSIDNKVTVAQSQFNMNINLCQGNSHDWHQSGGGAQIDFIYYPADNEVWPGYQPDVLRNSVSFYNTSFASNMACWGGAVSIVVSWESPGQSVTNSVLFDGCRFNHNLASIAAAIDVSILQPDLVTSNGTLMTPVFKDCKFLENGINDTSVVTGVVSTNFVPLNFSGVNNFTGNDGTALVVTETFVALSESSRIIFDSNTGRNGGALVFFGNSWLVMYKNTTLIFQKNSAESLGGAIYSVHFGKHDLMKKQNCFFQYYKATLCPSKWNATIRFTKNLARYTSNSIYMSSLLPCVWPGKHLNSSFCGHPWVFDDDDACMKQVSTGPSEITRGKDGFIAAVPGWRTWFNATLLNDFGQNIPSVFSAATFWNQSGIGVNKSTEYIADNNIIVYGAANTQATLLLRTLDPKVITSFLVVDIKDCPVGYKQQNCTMPGHEYMVCDCICADNIFGLGCNDISHHIGVYRGTCVTYSNNGTDWSEPVVVGNCPFVLEDLRFHYSFSYNPVNLSRKVCGKLNRTGFLCSKCIKGYGVDVNSHQFPCVKCNSRYTWFLFILAEVVPIVVFFIIVAFFNISMTSAPMNAFVFFSQIVTIPYFHSPYTFMFGYMFFPYMKVLETLVAFPYAIWNLNFFATAAIPGFCLHENLNTLEVLALKYLNAFLPLVLIFVCYILIKLYDRNCRAIRFIWCPFRKCLKKIYKNREPKTSIIDVFATFLLLSYSKVLFVSFSLFAVTSIRDTHTGGVIKSSFFYFDASVPMFHGKYAILSITALIIFALFVTLPPLFLTFYPLRCTQKVIDRLPFKITLRTFAEAFNGDFRDGTCKDGTRGDKDCRWFAGYYFMLRVIIFGIFVSELRWLDQYFIQQVLFAICIVLFANVRPYKENYYNKLDTAMFTLLAILNAFSLYNSQHFHSYNRIINAVFWINYLLMFLPLVYITYYIVYLMLLWKGWTKTKPSASISVVKNTSSIDGDEISENYNSIGSDDEDTPDRLVNPQNYNSRNLYRPFDPQGVPRQNKQCSRQGSSEKSYFNGKRDKKMVPYGSLSASVPGACHSEPASNDKRTSVRFKDV